MTDTLRTLIPRHVPARTIPTPNTVSAQLQASISQMAAVAAARPAAADSWVPETSAEWKATAAQLDSQVLATLPILSGLFAHTCVKREIAGVTVREITPQTLDPALEDRLLVHFHGGGYVLNGGEASAIEAIIAAHHCRLRVLSVDYRMPPDHPFPAAVEDAVSVWRALITERPASRIGAFGTSAGGGLTLAMALRLRELGLPLPAAIGAGTPWTDLTGSSDSYQVNSGVDGVFTRYDGFAAAMAALYAGATPIDHPLISPVHADFTGFPPTLFITGTRDILLSDTVRTYRAMKRAGVSARLEVHEAMSHAEYIYAFASPESAEAFGDLASFFDEQLGE